MHRLECDARKNIRNSLVLVDLWNEDIQGSWDNEDPDDEEHTNVRDDEGQHVDGVIAEVVFNFVETGVGKGEDDCKYGC